LVFGSVYNGKPVLGKKSDEKRTLYVLYGVLF